MQKRTIAVGTWVLPSFIIASSSRLLAQQNTATAKDKASGAVIHGRVTDSTGHAVMTDASGASSTSTLFMANAPSELYPHTVTSATDRFIHFMLNERKSEHCGEFHRWEDLVRTKSLYSRAALYNADVSSGFSTNHKLRPIPLLQITLQTVNGKPMDANQVKAYQNPGY